MLILKKNVLYLKFKLNWSSLILSGNRGSPTSNSGANLPSFFLPSPSLFMTWRRHISGVRLSDSYLSSATSSSPLKDPG